MVNSSKIGTLWLIGCGNMGSALLSRWLEAGIAERFVVIDPATVSVPAGVDLLRALPEPGQCTVPDVVVLAVKPQVAAAALKGMPQWLSARTLVVSIMAGLQIADVATMAGNGIVVRAMPNTPAAVGKGMTALFSPSANDSERAAAATLFDAVGKAIWLESEAQFDAVTAVSGSGPAYVFRFIEALAAAGEAAGLPAELAIELARETVIGAAALADNDPRPAQELRQAVTSPGGTTQAGLEMLDADPGLPQLVRNAVRAAAARSRELSETR